MNEDGTIDYSRHSLDELREACQSIDRARYPKNLKNLLTELAARGGKDPTTEPRMKAPEKNRRGSLVALYLFARGSYVTTIMICALAGIFALEVVGKGSGDHVEQAIRAAGLLKYQVRNGEWWRLLTGPLLHANFTHLYFNMFTLFLFGGVVERLVSREVIPLLILLTALGGSLASLVFLPHATTVGISGAGMGVMGFFLGWQMTRRPRQPAKAYSWVGINIALNLFMGAVGHQVIDNAAHLGGLLTGLVLGLALTSGERASGRTPLPMPAAVRWLGRLSAAVLLIGIIGTAALCVSA